MHAWLKLTGPRRGKQLLPELQRELREVDELRVRPPDRLVTLDRVETLAHGHEVCTVQMGFEIHCRMRVQLIGHS